MNKDPIVILNPEYIYADFLPYVSANGPQKNEPNNSPPNKLDVIEAISSLSNENASPAHTDTNDTKINTYIYIVIVRCVMYI